jgi:hypothetical protein
MKLYALPLLLLMAVPCLASSVAITTTKVPNGTVATSFSATVNASGGCTPYRWEVVFGSLPLGVTGKASSNTRSFQLSGHPTKAGVYSFSIEVKGCGGHVSTASYKSVIQASAEHVVNLSWTPSKSANISGYNMYRSSDGTTWKRVNASLIGSTTYSDTTVSNGNTYYYAATAVDVQGEESGMSSAVTTLIP